MCIVRIFAISDFKSGGKKCQDRGLNTGPPECSIAVETTPLLRGFSLLLSQLSYPGNRKNGFEGVPLQIRNNNSPLEYGVRSPLPLSTELRPSLSLLRFFLV